MTSVHFESMGVYGSEVYSSHERTCKIQMHSLPWFTQSHPWVKWCLESLNCNWQKLHLSNEECQAVDWNFSFPLCRANQERPLAFVCSLVPGNPVAPPFFVTLGTVTRPAHPYNLVSPAFTLGFIPAAGAGLIAQELSPSETVVKKQGPEYSHADPPAKRRWYFEPEDSDSDSESEEVFDLESYYDSATEDRTAEDVQKFISVAFKRYLSLQKRKEVAREYPKPQAAKASETDPLLADFLGKRYPEQQDI